MCNHIFPPSVLIIWYLIIPLHPKHRNHSQNYQRRSKYFHKKSSIIYYELASWGSMFYAGNLNRYFQVIFAMFFIFFLIFLIVHKIQL